MRLALSAFVTGFATLGLEITALRLLAPAFGSNLLVFSNVVGVVLAGLAAGAILGGRWADRRADPRRAGALMLAAGVIVAVLPDLARPFLAAARGALASGSASPFFWSLAGVTLLVLPPTLLLGAVAPFLVRLRVRRIEEVGSVAGSLSGAGTAGSLLGTFVPTLATIPFLGTTATLRLLGGAPDPRLGAPPRPARPRRPRAPARRGARARIGGPAAGSPRGARVAVPARPRRGALRRRPPPPRRRGPRGAVVVDPRATGSPARATTRSSSSTRRATEASARCSTSASREARSSTASGRRSRTSRSRESSSTR